VIASCPSCGTHYKHDAPRVPARARCGRCDTTLDLTRFRPYRIVAAGVPTREDLARTETLLPIGLDHPALATTIARNLGRATPVRQPDRPPGGWEDQDPLPPIPEMELRGPFDSTVPESSSGDMLAHPDAERSAGDIAAGADAVVPSRTSGGATTFALWLAVGIIAGTGASWMVGGTTIDGAAPGALAGALAGWGWLRWTSSR